MHHFVVDHWSQSDSPLHRRDARAKLFVLVATLLAVATAPAQFQWTGVGLAAPILAGFLIARIPLGAALLRGLVVLPFTATFALISYVGGDVERAAALLWKSYLSGLAVLLAVSTTPFPHFLRAAEWWGTPSFLVTVIQFVYRYLFVISEQVQHMRMAAACRGSGGRGWLFQRDHVAAAAGAVSVLFSRSMARAEGIHRAMIARGFRGHILTLDSPRFGWLDVVFAVAAAGGLVALRIVLGRVS